MAPENTAEELANPLGYHRGLPILHQRSRQNMGDAFNRSMEIAPILNLEPGGRLIGIQSLVHTGDTFSEVRSEDDETILLGYDQTVVFRVETAMIDDRKATSDVLDKMARRIAQEAEKKKAEKEGRFMLTGLEGDEPEVRSISGDDSPE